MQILDFLGIYDLPVIDPTSNSFVYKVTDFICKHMNWVCRFSMFVLTDREPSILDTEHLADYLKHYPANSSVKCLEHFTQLAKLPKGEFRKFDYGAAKNLEKYGTEEAPLFDFAKVVFRV